MQTRDVNIEHDQGAVVNFHHDDEFYRQEARAITKELAEHDAWKRRSGYGKKNPEGNEHQTRHGQNGTSHTGMTPPASTAVITNLEDVQAQPIRWHWPRRLARGKVSLFVGDPGVGKSALWMDLVARTSTGSTWPDGHAIPQGASVILSAEDALDDTIKPRLHAAGADMSCICANRCWIRTSPIGSSAWIGTSRRSKR